MTPDRAMRSNVVVEQGWEAVLEEILISQPMAAWALGARQARSALSQGRRTTIAGGH
jgi:hypothetical protein